MKENDQEVFDDGTSITNKCSVGRIKSMFEPAMQGSKPTLPSKPPAKPAPPKRAEDTKISNGDVKAPFKNNFITPKPFGEIGNKDENSNIQGNSEVKLNPEHVSKFNSKFAANENKDIVKTKPPWIKSNQSEEVSKPLENKTKPPDRLPIEGLASRLKKFENKNDNLSDTSENKSPTNEHISKLSDAKVAIAEKLQPKFQTPLKKDFKPSPVTKKPTSQLNGSVDESKSPQNSEKPELLAKPKPRISASPAFSPVPSQSNEFLLKLKKRQESIRKAESEEGNKGEQTQMRPGTRTRSVKRKSLTRVTDNKKFYLVEFSEKDSENQPPPSKPPKIDALDFDRIVSEHKRKFLPENEKERPKSQGVVEIVEDIYEELPGGEEEDDFPPPPSEETFSPPSSARPFSVIQPMTEEDELGADDIYDEGISATTTDTSPPNIPGRPPRRGNLSDEPLPEPPTTPLPGTDSSETAEPEQDELYEPLDEIANNVSKTEEQYMNSGISDGKSEEQLSEKERKKREKEEKKRLEQERKNQEKRLKELKKYKIDSSELEPKNSKGMGTVKEDSKGRGKDLAVKKGQRVVIICMDTRVPKGKWMVKLADGEEIGFVDSNNVEVMEGSMKKTSMESLTEDQEEYEAVEPEQDDVYSEAS